MKIKDYYYVGKVGLIRIKSKRKPSVFTQPRCGTWVVSEYNFEEGGWVMPCFPEITVEKINEMQFLGLART